MGMDKLLDEKIGHSTTSDKRIVCEAHNGTHRVIIRSSEYRSFDVVITIIENGAIQEFRMNEMDLRLLRKAADNFLKEQWPEKKE
jgi:hypothetical protein